MEKPASHPSTIGRFTVESVLGTGGMGAVYKAFDPTLKRTVAVKTVRPDIHDPDLLDRLLREAQACARLRHPNVVTIYEAGTIEGSVYIAMEYVVGDSLSVVLQRGGLGFEETLRVLIQILDALDHVHREGVVHRDIKPANILRQPDGSIKLVDFGLARIAQAESMTVVGMVVGTPGYASPEQLRGESIDLRTDIYSTGVVAYEMISGRRPFAGGGDVGSLMYKVVHEPVPSMNVYWSQTFPEIERIVTRAVEKSPASRYQSAADMRDALRAFLTASAAKIGAAARQQGIPPADGTASTVVLPKSLQKAAATDRRWLAGAGVALAVVAVAGVLFFRSSGPGTGSGDERRGGAVSTPVEAVPPASASSPPAGTAPAASAAPLPAQPAASDPVTIPSDSGQTLSGPATASPQNEPSPRSARDTVRPATPPPGLSREQVEARCARLVERGSLGE